MFTSFPWIEVQAEIATIAHRALRGHDVEEWADSALMFAYGRWDRQQRKEWTIRHLARGGLLDVLSQRMRSRETADSESVELLAATRQDHISLDDILAGLSERDARIVVCWSDGRTDRETSQIVGCHVNTLTNVRQRLAGRLEKQLA